MAKRCNMYSYFACSTILVIVLIPSAVKPQGSTSIGPTATTVTFNADTVTSVNVQNTGTTAAVTEATTTITSLDSTSVLFTDDVSATTISLTGTATDVTTVTAPSSVLTTPPATLATEDTTITAVITESGTDISTTSFKTTDANISDGSGSQGETTTFVTDGGSGTETTTFQEASGAVTTTGSFVENSGSGAIEMTTSPISTGSGDDIETTIFVVSTGSGGTFETTTFVVSTGSGAAIETTTDFFGSGDGAANDTTTDATTVFEVSTGFNTTFFNATTGAITETAAGFPWYIIVISCLAIIIVALIIFIIVFFWCKRKPGPALLQKASPIDATDTAAEATPKSLQHAAQPTQRPIVPAPTVLPPKTVEEPKIDFVSTSPMRAPLFIHDPSASVRKRDKARARPQRPRASSFDDDEGFNEPLMREAEREHRKRAKRRRPPIENAREVTTESEVEPLERTVTYHPYFLPTPIQTALTGKGLGDQLTDDAMAEREYLQRSDIERHKTKQRLRMQRRRQQNESFKDEQRTIDEVLQPLPPKSLQGFEERRRLQKHGLVDDDDRPTRKSRRRKSSRRRSERSNSSEDTTESEEKRSAHETVIAKMTKLLEDAYALLAPAIQKTPVKPFHSNGAYSQQQPVNTIHQPQDQRLFTRTNTPPVLMPQSGLHGQMNPSYMPGTIPERANDSQSPVWTPYRSFDRFQELQKRDPSISNVPTRPAYSGQNIPTPRSPNQSNLEANFVPLSFPSRPGVHDPFAPMEASTSIPMPQPDSFQMNLIGSTATAENPVRQPNIATSERNFVDTGVEEPAASIVQSIRDTLAELSGKRASDNPTQGSNC